MAGRRVLRRHHHPPDEGPRGLCGSHRPELRRHVAHQDDQQGRGPLGLGLHAHPGGTRSRLRHRHGRGSRGRRLVVRGAPRGGRVRVVRHGRAARGGSRPRIRVPLGSRWRRQLRSAASADDPAHRSQGRRLRPRHPGAHRQAHRRRGPDGPAPPRPERPRASGLEDAPNLRDDPARRGDARRSSGPRRRGEHARERRVHRGRRGVRAERDHRGLQLHPGPLPGLRAPRRHAPRRPTGDPLGRARHGPRRRRHRPALGSGSRSPRWRRRP